MLGLPLELGVGQGRVGGQVKDVTVPAGANLVGQLPTDGLGKGLDHVIHGRALARSQVPGLGAGSLGVKVVERDNVTTGEIEDVDVVTNSRSVLGGVILIRVSVRGMDGYRGWRNQKHIKSKKRKLTITKNEQLLTLANSNLSQQRKQVVRNSGRILTHDATGVGSRRVEVPQQGGVVERLIASLGLGSVSLGVDPRSDHLLDSHLCVAVRVRGAERADLGDGNHVREAGGITIDCGRG